MFCDEALDAVESIADGAADARGARGRHLATCPNCAAALASARRLEAALRARPAPRAPARFTSRTMAMLRRKRWRSEQFVDVGFNVALAAVALLVVAGVGRAAEPRGRDVDRQRCVRRDERRRPAARAARGAGGAGLRRRDRAARRGARHLVVGGAGHRSVNRGNSSAAEVGRRQAPAAAAAAAVLSAARSAATSNRSSAAARCSSISTARGCSRATTSCSSTRTPDLIGCYETVRDAPDDVAAVARRAGGGARARRPRALLRRARSPLQPAARRAPRGRTDASPTRRSWRRCSSTSIAPASTACSA